MESLPEYFRNLPVLETERLLLRPVRAADLQDMWEYLRDEGISEFTTWDYHRDMKTTEAYLEYVLRKYATGQIENWGLELKSERKFIGMAGFGDVNPEHRHGEIGFVLSAKFWNRGLMSEAVTRILVEGFGTIGLDRIMGRCIAENHGSKRVFEKAGFTPEGKFRKHFIKSGVPRDILLFGLLKNDHRATA